jgi:hypothetical protein
MPKKKTAASAATGKAAAKAAKKAKAMAKVEKKETKKERATKGKRKGGDLEDDGDDLEAILAKVSIFGHLAIHILLISTPELGRPV